MKREYRNDSSETSDGFFLPIVAVIGIALMMFVGKSSMMRWVDAIRSASWIEVTAERAAGRKYDSWVTTGRYGGASRITTASCTFRYSFNENYYEATQSPIDLDQYLRCSPGRPAWVNPLNPSQAIMFRSFSAKTNFLLFLVLFGVWFCVVIFVGSTVEKRSYRGRPVHASGVVSNGAPGQIAYRMENKSATWLSTVTLFVFLPPFAFGAMASVLYRVALTPGSIPIFAFVFGLCLSLLYRKLRRRALGLTPDAELTILGGPSSTLQEPHEAVLTIRTLRRIVRPVDLKAVVSRTGRKAGSNPRNPRIASLKHRFNLRAEADDEQSIKTKFTIQLPGWGNNARHDLKEVEWRLTVRYPGSSFNDLVFEIPAYEPYAA